MTELKYTTVDKLGKIYKTNKSGDVEVIEIVSTSKVVVKFLNTQHTKLTSMSNLVHGGIKDDSISFRVLKDKDSPRKFCVYFHKDEYGVIRYIGEGTRTRAYNLTRSDQPNYLRLLNGAQITVEIVAENLLKSEAEDLELKLREVHKSTIINNKHATKRAKEIDYNFISNYLEYDTTSTTFLRWKKVFASAYSRVKVGSEAGGSNQNGYFYTMLNTESYAQHRLIWVLHNKSLPPDMLVDHIDGNKGNNSIENLRLVSPRQNSLNKVGKIPQSGYRNITELKYKGKSYSYIVRWHEENDPNRHWVIFKFKNTEEKLKAFQDAYTFRETLFDSNIFNFRVKEGEVTPSFVLETQHGKGSTDE